MRFLGEHNLTIKFERLFICMHHCKPFFLPIFILGKTASGFWVNIMQRNCTSLYLRNVHGVIDICFKQVKCDQQNKYICEKGNRITYICTVFFFLLLNTRFNFMDLPFLAKCNNSVSENYVF